MLFLAVALCGCSGGGGSSDGAGPSDVAAPSATITFPGTTALVPSGRLTVRGTASAQNAIAGVRVNGVPAASVDGFATWEATLDLPGGTNALTVSTEDVKGNRSAAAAASTVAVGPWLSNSQRIAVEATGQILVLVGTNAVWRVDPSSGARTIVSDASTGGPSFQYPQGIAVESTGQIVVTDSNRVMRVDPRTGIRTIVSDATIGSGPPFSGALGAIAVETTGKLVVLESTYAAGTYGSRVVRIDPSSGTRSIVSDASIGGGPALGASGSIAVEPTGQLIVADYVVTYPRPYVNQYWARLVRVDPQSGARSVVSVVTNENQQPTFLGNRVVVDRTGQLIVLESFWGKPSLTRIDPRSGARTIVSDATVGSGPIYPLDISAEPTGQLIVLGSDYVARVDPSSGTCTMISSVSIGIGPSFYLGYSDLPKAVAVEPTGQIIVAENNGGVESHLIRVDPRSGSRTVIADVATGSGPLLATVNGVAIDRTGGIFALDRYSSVGNPDYSRIVRVDQRNGARSVVADKLSRLLTAIAIDASGQIVVAGGANYQGDVVLRVDPQSGASTTVSATPPPDLSGTPGPIHGIGLPTISGIAVEPTGQLLLGGYSMVRVDPRSGARTAVSGGAIGGIAAIEPTGQIMTIGRSTVIRFDPTTGNRTTIFDATALSGVPAFELRGIAVEASGQLVAISSYRAVLRIDPLNGALAIISR